MDKAQEKATLRLQQSEHKPRMTKQMTLKPRNKQNRPNLLVEAVDNDEVINKSPNLVIAPMGSTKNSNKAYLSAQKDQRRLSQNPHNLSVQTSSARMLQNET